MFTEGFKKFVKIVAVLGILIGGYVYADKSGLLKKVGPKGKVVSNDLFKGSSAGTETPGKLTRPMKVGINAWCGFAGGPYTNGGFKASTTSGFYTKYGLQVEFVHNDNFAAGKAAWQAGQLDAWYCTVDSFPVDAGGLVRDEPVIVMQTDWSRGGDAIVVSHEIQTVADLTGKDVACAIGSPSHTLLLWTLSANNMASDAINIVKTQDGVDSANTFKAKKVPAAVVWAPDDQDCVEHVPGAHVLISSKNASHIIADCIYVKKSFLDAHPDDVKALVEGWLEGNAAINSSEVAKNKAAEILADGFNSDKGYCTTGINNARLCTYGDNQNFFGLNKAYKGITGQTLYDQMSGVYQQLKLADDKLPMWRNIMDVESLKAITTLARKVDLAEGETKFAKLTEEAEGKLTTVANKRVTINFPSGSSELTDDAQYIIQDKFGPLVQGFANIRIKVEGNTDNTGGDAINGPLSKSRAKAVVEYLVVKYHLDPNRFIVAGNGSNKPVADNSTDEGRSQNRRTDFELVN